MNRSEWSPCTSSCGNGEKARTRLYINPEAIGVCNVELIQKATCFGNRPECNPSYFNYSIADSRGEVLLLFGQRECFLFFLPFFLPFLSLCFFFSSSSTHYSLLTTQYSLLTIESIEEKASVTCVNDAYVSSSIHLPSFTSNEIQQTVYLVFGDIQCDTSFLCLFGHWDRLLILISRDLPSP